MIIGEFSFVDESGTGGLVEEQVALLGDDEEQAVLWAAVQEHWRVALLLELNFRSELNPILFGSRGTNLDDVQELGWLILPLLTETKEAIVISWHA